MINDVKMGFRLLRFAHGIKGNIACGVILMVAGMLVLACSARIPDLSGNAGSLMMISGMMPTQLMYSLNVTNWVQSSPSRKRLQTSVPVFCTFVTMTTVFLFVVAFKGILVLLFPESQVSACGEIVVIAFFSMIVMLYLAMAYKMFWLGTILFFVAYMATVYIMRKGDWIWRLEIFSHGGWSYALAIIIGLVMMAVATALSYGVSLAVYKLPVSKMSMPATLRKYI